MKKSSSSYPYFIPVSCVKKSSYSQILMYGGKKNPAAWNILILLTKGEDVMSFCANASPTLISSHWFYLLCCFTCTSLHLSSFLRYITNKSHFFQRGEGYRRTRRPTSGLQPWAFVSWKQDYLWENKSALLTVRQTQSAVVSFDVGSYWVCTCAFTYPCVKIKDMQLSSLCWGISYVIYELFKPLFFHH